MVYKRKQKTGAKKVGKAVKTYVKRVLDKKIENKEAFLDYAAVNPISYTTGSAYLVSHGAALAQGAGDSNRIGERIYLRRLRIRILAGSISNIENPLIRLLLLRVKSPEGTVYAPNDLFVNTAGVGVVRPTRANAKDTIEIMMDRTYNVPPLGNISNGAKPYLINIDRKIDKYVSYYPAAAAGTIADIKTNAFYLVAIATETAAGGASAGQIADLQVSIVYEDA